MKAVFLDKDGTWGRFQDGDKGLFPNTAKFLERQKNKQRRLYVVTSAGLAGAKHVDGLPLDGYFGREQSDVSRLSLYILPDGTMRNIHDDYKPRENFETAEKRKNLDEESQERADRMYAIRGDTAERRRLQAEINKFFGYWGELLHKETQAPFNETTRYQNPNTKHSFFKDLYLVRRLIAPKRYDEIKAAMVGDYADENTVTSNPETPLIVISGRVASGNWTLVEAVLDQLFSDDNTQTWEMFESLYSISVFKGKNRVISLSGFEYGIKKGEREERIIYCP